MRPDRLTPHRRIAALVALVLVLWASQDCPAAAVRLAAVGVYVVGVALLVPTRAAMLAFAGFTVVGAGLFVLLDAVVRLPFAGIVTGVVLAALTAAGSRAALRDVPGPRR